MLRTRLLEALGWKVISVPFFQWNDMRGDEGAKATYLRQRLSHFVPDFYAYAQGLLSPSSASPLSSFMSEL